MLPKSRRNNTYCRRSNVDSFQIADISGIRQLSSLWYGQLDDDHHRDDHYNPTRYFGFNIHSYFYQKSLEIRYHSSTTNFVKVINWIKINQAIFDYALSHNVKDILNLKNFDDCKTNYSRIRKLFKAVVRKDSLWKYYKDRFSAFSEGQKEYGYYKIQTSEEMRRAEEQAQGNINRVEVNEAIDCLNCDSLNAQDNTCENVSCTGHPRHEFLNQANGFEGYRQVCNNGMNIDCDVSGDSRCNECGARRGNLCSNNGCANHPHYAVVQV